MQDNYNPEQSDEARPLQSLLTTGKLAPLVAKAHRISAINQLCRQQLPLELTAHVQAMNFDDKQLTLVCDSAQWVLATHQHAPTLLSACQAAWPYAKNWQKIELKVRP